MRRSLIVLLVGWWAVASPEVRGDAADGQNSRDDKTAPSAGSGTVDTLLALKAIDPDHRLPAMAVTVKGYHRAGDGGGGVFRFDPVATAKPDDGLTIRPDQGEGRWIRLHPGTLDVRWFGATGDGTDDTAALAAALAAGAGKTVTLPAGVFVTGAPLWLQADTVLEGTGTASVLKLGPGFPRDANAIYAGGVVHVVIRNFLIACDGRGTSAIALQGCSECEVSGMTIQSPFHCGILAYDEAYRNRIINNTVLDQLRPTGFAVCLFHAACFNEVRGNTIKDHTGIGILVDDGTVDQTSASSDDNIVADNILTATRHGGFSIVIEGSVRNTVANNRVDCAGTYAIDVACGNSAPVVPPKNNTVLGNIINAAITGVRLQGENNQVSANRISAGNMGIDIQNSGANSNPIARNLVADNVIGPVADRSQPAQAGIFVDDANARDNRIVGNAIFGAGRCGIWHQNGTATEIAYNSVTDSGRFGVLMDRDITGTSIHHNVIWTGAGWGSGRGVFLAGGGTTYRGVQIHGNCFASERWFSGRDSEMVVRGEGARCVDCGFDENMWLGSIRELLGRTTADRQVIPVAPVNGAIRPELSSPHVCVTILTSSTRILAPIQPKIGQSLTFIFVQDDVGGRSVEWDPVFRQQWTDRGNMPRRKSVIIFTYDGKAWTQLGAQSPYS